MDDQHAAGMTARPGTYAVIFHCRSQASTQVGRWGELALRKGYYVYVGSAFGPGGVLARVSRHCRREKARRWHIDYLRPFVSPRGAWYSHAAQRLEHHWAACLAGMPGAAPIAKFGCSDCRCNSHLFYFAQMPDLAAFQALVYARVGNWSYR